jgi:hypothetical protein
MTYLCEHGDETSGSLKSSNFERLYNHQQPKEHCFTRSVKFLYRSHFDELLYSSAFIL